MDDKSLLNLLNVFSNFQRFFTVLGEWLRMFLGMLYTIWTHVDTSGKTRPFEIILFTYFEIQSTFN